MVEDSFRIVKCILCGKNRQVNLLFDGCNRMHADDKGCECLRRQPKVEVTYVAHRGIGPDVNLFPAKEWLTLRELYAKNLEDAQRTIRANGFYKTYSSGVKVYITPAAILEVRLVQKVS